MHLLEESARSLAVMIADPDHCTDALFKEVHFRNNWSTKTRNRLYERIVKWDSESRHHQTSYVSDYLFWSICRSLYCALLYHALQSIWIFTLALQLMCMWACVSVCERACLYRMCVCVCVCKVPPYLSVPPGSEISPRFSCICMRIWACVCVCVHVCVCVCKLPGDEVPSELTAFPTPGRRGSETPQEPSWELTRRTAPGQHGPPRTHTHAQTSSQPQLPNHKRSTLLLRFHKQREYHHSSIQDKPLRANSLSLQQ